MKLKFNNKLNQSGSLHLVLPVLVALVVIAAVVVRVTMVSDAATKPAAVAKPKLAAPVKDIAYGSDPLQKLDIFAAKNPNAPVVVFVHGGGWTTNDKSQFGSQAKSLQLKGDTVFNINYRLDSATVGAFPMEVDDVKAATQYALSHAAQYNGNPSKVILLGGSAGGQLVGMAAIQLNNATAGTVKGVVTLSGPTDFISLVQDDKNGTLGTKRTEQNFAQNIPQALGCALNACTVATETQWSPASQVTASNCPSNWLIFNSQSELIPLDQPTAMDNALRAAGCHDTKTIVPGSEHAFAYWGKVKPAIVSFIQAL
jgi:acetyl esterase/lipase